MCKTRQNDRNHLQPNDSGIINNLAEAVTSRLQTQDATDAELTH